MLWERHKVLGHNHEALGEWRPACLYVGTCSLIRAGHCQHWRRWVGIAAGTSLSTLSKWNKRNRYYDQCYKGRLCYFTHLSTARAVSLRSQLAFTGHAISLQTFFKLLKMQLAPASYPLPKPLFLMKATLSLSLVKGQCFQGVKKKERKQHNGLYMHLIKNIRNVHKSSQVRKRKGQLHKDVIAINDLVVKARADYMAKLNKAPLPLSCPLPIPFSLSMQ